MPDVKAAVDAYSPEFVTFATVNQAETTPIVTDFLEKREWENIPVALDFDMKTSNAFEVDSIPHTVVIDREGNISWIHIGYDESLKQSLFEAIRNALTN